MNDQKQAAEALAQVRAHQERARRSARVPWWMYVALFVVIVGIGVANDHLPTSAAPAVAIGVLVALGVTLTMQLGFGFSPLHRYRGAQVRQTFSVRTAVAMVLIGVGLGQLVTQYADQLYGRLGSHAGTVGGLITAAVFTPICLLSNLWTERRAAGR